MAKFKRSTNLSGKIENIISNGDMFIDGETGEEINLFEILNSVYGNTPFSISTSQKIDEELS